MFRFLIGEGKIIDHVTAEKAVKEIARAARKHQGERRFFRFPTALREQGGKAKQHQTLNEQRPAEHDFPVLFEEAERQTLVVKALYKKQGLPGRQFPRECLLRQCFDRTFPD